jgi:hypothetical protein
MVNETDLEHDGRILPGFTRISVNPVIDHHGNATGEVNGHVEFGDVTFGETVNAWVDGIERFEVVSDGPVSFVGFGDIFDPLLEITSSLEFVGGQSDDMIGGARGDDYLEGGVGNDRIWNNGGSDRIVSGVGDEDLIEVSNGNDRVVVTGFNGAGAAGGDELLLGGDIFRGEDVPLTVKEDQTGTLISWSYIGEGLRVTGSVHVDAVDLVEGIDYGYSVGSTWLQRTVLPDYGFVA